MSLAAIWVEDRVSYWDDGTTGGLLAALCLFSALLLAADVLRPGRGASALAVVALVLFGLYLFSPVGLAFDQLGEVRAGGWLGVAGGALLAGGAHLRLPSGSRALPLGAIPRLAAVAGAGLAIAGIFSDVLDLGPEARALGYHVTYWDFPPAGHSFGIFLLVLACVALAMLALGWAMRGTEADGIAAAVSFLLVGFALRVPLAAAFDGLDSLGPGAWLALGGGALAAAGTLPAYLRSPAPEGAAPSPQGLAAK